MKIKIVYPTGREELIDVQSGETGFVGIMGDEGYDNFHEDTNIAIIDGELVGTKYMGVDGGTEYAEWGTF